MSSKPEKTTPSASAPAPAPAPASSPATIIGSTPKRAQILNFERIMSVADELSKSAFEERRKMRKRKMQDTESTTSVAQPIVKLGFDDDDDNDNDNDNQDEHTSEENTSNNITRALAAAISALTGAEKPSHFTSPGGAMRWASNAILAARDKSIDEARRESQLYVLDADQTLEAMKLMSGLNDLLSQTRTRQSEEIPFP
jgi:hypothetical protein